MHYLYLRSLHCTTYDIKMVSGYSLKGREDELGWKSTANPRREATGSRQKGNWNQREPRRKQSQNVSWSSPVRKTTANYHQYSESRDDREQTRDCYGADTHVGDTLCKQAVLLAKPKLSRMKYNISPGERRVRVLSSQSKSIAMSSYQPPTIPLDSVSSGTIGSDDATGAPSVYGDPPQRQIAMRHQRQFAVSSNSLDNTATDRSAGNTTLSNAEGGLSWDYTTGREAATDLQSMSTQTSDDLLAAEKYKSQSTEDGGWSEDLSAFQYQQGVAGMTIALSAAQLALVLIQIILCGVAPFEVNPMIGPFPDSFSEWGGKNAYLMMDGNQYWRLLSPVFLHVGILHLLVNIACQFHLGAIFERQWGSATWLSIYLISGVGAVASSCVFNPDEIGVSSSGALMGLFGSKLSEIVTCNLFELETRSRLQYVRLNLLGNVLCSSAVIFLLCFVTYIDISGHIGGLLSGILVGVIAFCNRIESGCLRFLWAVIGLFGLCGGGAYLGFLLWVETYPDEELGDACEYFRHLYPEGYECECKWS